MKKKFFAIVLSVVMALGVAACGKDDPAKTGKTMAEVREHYEAAGYTLTETVTNTKPSLTGLHANLIDNITVVFYENDKAAEKIKPDYDKQMAAGMECKRDGSNIYYGTAAAVAVYTAPKVDPDGPDDGGTDVEGTIKVDNVSTQNLLRSIQIADATLFKYIDRTVYERTGEVKMAKSVSRDGKADSTASVWHYTTAMEMLNSLLKAIKPHRAEQKVFDELFKYYETVLEKVYEGMDYYKGTAVFRSYTRPAVTDPETGITTGTEWTVYAVNRAGEKGKANVEDIYNVYDDQMWIIRELLNAYKITGNKTYLERGEYLTQYCLDGWDKTLKPDGTEYGGITWGPGYSSRHTCSNGPIISPLVWLSEIYEGTDDTLKDIVINPDGTREEKSFVKTEYYLNYAEKVYDYCYTHLMGKAGVYADNINNVSQTTDENGYKVTTSGGSLTGDPLTYNSGSVLSGLTDLYRVTKKQRYFDEAVSLADAAFDYFADGSVKEGYYLYPSTSNPGELWTNGTWFNNVLMRAFVEVTEIYEGADRYVGSFQKTLDYGYEHYYYNGLLPTDLLNGWNPGYVADDKVPVMDTFTIASAFSELAIYTAGK